jgi:hypothetical protein
MIEQSPIPFKEHLDAYALKVSSLCRRLVQAATSSNNRDPLLLWLTLLVLNTTLFQEQKNQFLQTVAAGENSAKVAGFHIVDQLDDFGVFRSWNRSRK